MMTSSFTAANSTAANSVSQSVARMTRSTQSRRRTCKASKRSSALELFLEDPIDWFCQTRPVVALAAFYSLLIEETVSPIFALHLTHVIIAMTALFFPVTTSFGTYLALFAWFAASLLGATHAYRTQKPASES